MKYRIVTHRRKPTWFNSSDKYYTVEQLITIKKVEYWCQVGDDPYYSSEEEAEIFIKEQIQSVQDRKNFEENNPPREVPPYKYL